MAGRAGPVVLDKCQTTLLLKTRVFTKVAVKYMVEQWGKNILKHSCVLLKKSFPSSYDHFGELHVVTALFFRVMAIHLAVKRDKGENLMSFYLPEMGSYWLHSAAIQANIVNLQQS